MPVTGTLPVSPELPSANDDELITADKDDRRENLALFVISRRSDIGVRSDKLMHTHTHKTAYTFFMALQAPDTFGKVMSLLLGTE